MKISFLSTAITIAITIAFAIFAVVKGEYAIAACLFTTAGVATLAWEGIETSEFSSENK